MSDVAIRVQNLSKCYHIYDNPRDRLKQFIAPRLQRLAWQRPKQYFKEFWALKDVSFEIKKGETVGIIGRNGSGKSTLLQMICGTLTPTHGSIETNGRIAALLELGSGFNPEFTGRENVYMNASVLGLSNQEIDERFDDIEAFADIGEFIEQPVKTYSSGMFVRLAFAVNIMSAPEIMIVDEALAVGDMAFQAKCMTALKRMQAKGVTVLFVSHDVSALKSLCSGGIYLDHGQLKKIGPSTEVADLYVRIMREEMNKDNINSISVVQDKEKILGNSKEGINKLNSLAFKVSTEFDQRIARFRYGDGGAKITFVELLDEYSTITNNIEFDQTVVIKIHFESSFDGELSSNYYIADDKKNYILGAYPQIAGIPLISVVNGGRYIIEFRTRLPLHEGQYSIRLELTVPIIPDTSARFLDVIDDAIVFNVARRTGVRLWAKVFIENEVNLISC